jgi:hypothetical protein
MSEADRQLQKEPKSAVDVAEEVFPEKVGGLFGGFSQLGTMLTKEDLLNILIRSRVSYEDSWKETGRKDKR